LGMVPYWVIVLLGYRDLGWSTFPYKEYYPYYFDPYWWEMFLVPVWGAVIALSFGLPCYYLGKRFGGKATFKQVLAIVMLASIVSLPIMVTVDLLIPNPEHTYQFATTGSSLNPYQPGENLVLWVVEQTYFYAAMTWQGIVTLITDHHDLPPTLPDADAVVNPKRLPADHPVPATLLSSTPAAFLM